jgi:hypothetical protein
LSEFRNSEGTVLLRSTAGKWGKTRHEKVETWEWDHVDSEFTEIGVKLTRESEACGDTGHGGGDEVVKVTVRWGGKFKSSEADIVESFVINGVGFVSVFDELVDGESGVVWFDDGVRHFRGWDDGESVHDTVRVFFTNLGNKKRSETRSGTTTERVCELETLEAVTSFGFFANNIQYGVNELGTFCVVSLGPVISSTRLSEDKVVRSENLSEWSRSN